MADSENDIRRSLLAFGLRMGKVARGRFKARVVELTVESGSVMQTFIHTILQVWKAIASGYNVLHKTLIGIVAADPLCRRFMTVPAVGPIAALSFRAGVDDPLSYERSRAVGAHFWFDTLKIAEWHLRYC